MSVSIAIKKISANAMLPQRMSDHAAGYDLYSANPENIVIKPGERCLIPTGLAIALPVSYEAQIRPRSGLAIKHGITVLNSPGTIDADYRGEIMVILINLGQESFVVEPNSRVAQMIISKHEMADFNLCEDLSDTQRGIGGFGSTNI